MGDYLAASGDSIRHLELALCDCLTEESLFNVSRHCPNLEHLELKDLHFDEYNTSGHQSGTGTPTALGATPRTAGTKALYYILSNCSRLAYLTLIDVSGLSFDVFKQFAVPTSPVVVIHLKISGVDSIRSEDLCVFPAVQQLTISNCPYLTYIPVQRGLTELRTLSLLSIQEAGLNLHNLYDLCMLGRGETVRRGKGKRGLRKLVLDIVPSAHIFKGKGTSNIHR